MGSGQLSMYVCMFPLSLGTETVKTMLMQNLGGQTKSITILKWPMKNVGYQIKKIGT